MISSIPYYTLPECWYCKQEYAGLQCPCQEVRTMSNKSALDNVPVSDKAFPLSKHLEQGPPLVQVSVCPHCGAPVYGRTAVFPKDEPIVKYSCACRKDRFEDQVVTK